MMSAALCLSRGKVWTLVAILRHVLYGENTSSGANTWESGTVAAALAGRVAPGKKHVGEGDVCLQSYRLTISRKQSTRVPAAGSAYSL